MVVLRMHNRTDATRVRERLQHINQQKWGFFIYRTCYYDNPTRWNQFKGRLKEFARRKLLNSDLDPEGDGAAMINDLEWKVQEDPAMEGCSLDEVRRCHQDLIWSLYGAYGPSIVRWRYPIFIDKESVDSVLAGPAPRHVGFR